MPDDTFTPTPFRFSDWGWAENLGCDADRIKVTKDYFIKITERMVSYLDGRSAGAAAPTLVSPSLLIASDEAQS